MANQVVKLKKGSDYLYPYAVLNKIDTSNLIASVSEGALTGLTYTATEDCFAICGACFPEPNKYGESRIYINNVLVQYGINAEVVSFGDTRVIVPITTGDVVTISGNRNDMIAYVKAFGIKR